MQVPAPQPDALERLVELSVAAVVAADEGEATVVDGEDPVARRVHHVVDAIAVARPGQAPR